MTFGLGAPRHVSVGHADPEAIPTRASWWEAPAVELSRTLVEAGRLPGQGNGRPARLDRGDDRRTVLRQRQLAQEQRLASAAAGLVEAQAWEWPLDTAQAAVLLRLLDIALAARVAGRSRVPLVASAHGVRLTLTPAPGRFTTVRTVDGALHLDGFVLGVEAAEHTVARPRELVSV
jgi:hypothetical protein